MTERERSGRSVAFVVFTLRFVEAGGVSVPSLQSSTQVHAEVATGPDGRAWIPGTSLAGALRDMVRRERGEEAADLMFGKVPSGGDTNVEAQASQVWVLGSRRKAGDGTEVRAGTKINRKRAAAETATLRVEELLPAGSAFEVFLRWDDPPPGEPGNLASMLASWRPYIGRGVSRGHGACIVDAVRFGTLRLDDPEGLHRWLTMSGPELASMVAATEVPVTGGTSGEPVLQAEVSIDGPWRTGTGEIPEDGPIPLFRAGADFVMPGSGVKGLLRSRAEFILRSVGAVPEPCLDQQCGSCWPCRVFGHGGGRDQSAATVGVRSLIRIPDAVIQDAAPATRTHIAIDRFTGGVLDGALYTMEVLEAGTFTLRVEPLGTIDQTQLQEIRSVLRLVLDDLNDGIIGMGGGVARGYGTVKVNLAGLPELAEAHRELARMTGDGQHDG
jgi:CRISPR/Cas system CSM-associated protein Csm3 (group 7 of RAMP superfamily)